MNLIHNALCICTGILRTGNIWQLNVGDQRLSEFLYYVAPAGSRLALRLSSPLLHYVATCTRAVYAYITFSCTRTEE